MTSTIKYTVAEGVETFPMSRGNAITANYYWFLVGEINNGTVKKAVARVTNLTFGTESYYLISQP